MLAGDGSIPFDRLAHLPVLRNTYAFLEWTASRLTNGQVVLVISVQKSSCEWSQRQAGSSGFELSTMSP